MAHEIYFLVSVMGSFTLMALDHSVIYYVCSCKDFILFCYAKKLYDNHQIKAFSFRIKYCNIEVMTGSLAKRKLQETCKID